MSNYFSVCGGCGDLKVDIATGKVIDNDFAGEEYANIVRFNVEEWRRYYPDERLEDMDYIDILDLGFWTKDGSYEEPEEDWREDLRKYRAEMEKTT